MKRVKTKSTGTLVNIIIVTLRLRFSDCLSVCLFACLSVSLSVRLSVCISICL